MLKQIRYIYKLDWLLFAIVLILSLWGIAVIYSIALGQGAINEGDIWSSVFLKKQIIALIVGICTLFFLSFVNYHIFYTYSRYLFFAIIIILILLLFFGINLRGTTGWFQLFGFSFQPVELAKFVVIAILAKYFSDNARYLAQFRHIFFSAFFLFIIVALILAQPDFGSAAVLMSLWIGVMFSAGIPKKNLFGVGALILLVVIFSWFFVFKDYQKDRIRVFLDPSSDPMGSGYNVTQSIIAIGSGQLAGKGLGFGSQSQLKFLPESHTDFIFAVIAEEMGFVSIFLFLFLFSLLFYRIIRIGRKSIDDFGLLFCMGIAISLFAQMFINIAMNMGLMPVTGLPLPFVSFGGSSLVVSFAMIGVVQNVHIKEELKSLGG